MKRLGFASRVHALESRFFFNISLDLFHAVGPSSFFFFAQVLLEITFSRWFGPEYWFAAHPLNELRSCHL
jgi:hypothetical protein